MPCSDHPAYKLCEEVLYSIKPQYNDMLFGLNPSSNVPATIHVYVMYKRCDEWCCTWWDCSFVFDVREDGLTADEFRTRFEDAISRSRECKTKLTS